MNSSTDIPNSNGTGMNPTAEAALKDLDATLRLLAKLPAPAGIEDRVFARLLASPQKAKILEWPRPLYARDWVRRVAAAAIVLVVSGGGWGIYAHIPHNQPARVVAAPRPAFQQGGFSSAGMMRRPQTLNGPIVDKAKPAKGSKSHTAELTTAKKPRPPITASGRHAVTQPVQTGADK